MHSEVSQRLTNRFYQWEQRGRGWHLFDFQVELEPEYFPFFHPMHTSHFIDDAKRHTLASWVMSGFSRKKQEAKATDIFEDIPPVMAYEYEEDTGLVGYEISFPKGEKLQVKDMVQLLTMLSYTKHPISFEIHGSASSIAICLICRESDDTHIYAQIRAYLPLAIVIPSDRAGNIFTQGLHTCTIDFGLTEEYMCPIATAGDITRDPYVGILAALEHLRHNERGVVQILFKGTANPWAESIMRSVTDGHGHPFFEDAPEMVKMAEQKVASLLFSVCIKVSGQSNTRDRAIDISQKILLALVTATRSPYNALNMLPQAGYRADDMMIDMVQRRSHRIGMLLSTAELATLVHIPTPDVASHKLVRDVRKTKAAPESAQGHQMVLGINMHHGAERIVSVPASLRLRHTHVIGATGTGKSTLLLSMIAQDMEHGNGIAVIDPHGDLIETILTYVPAERIKDVIVIDPADCEYPVGFNILSAHSEIEKEILASDLVAAFRRLSTSWGDQMNSVLANAILAFLESSEGGTLLDLHRFLVEQGYRDTHLKTVSEPNIVYYWQHEYPLLKSSSIGSILTRLDAFLRPKIIRNMVTQQKSLDFEHILDTKKILLIKLSQGLIGAENSYLLGTFFVSKMYQAAMARQGKSKDSRSDFFCYIDEFHHFATPSMSHILSGARKYHVGLILAHQDMAQLTKYDSELASSVVVNSGTRICFRLGDTDAKRFASGFSFFEAQDLENLHTGEAIARVEQPNCDFNLTTIQLPAISKGTSVAKTEAVIAASRSVYGTPRADIEHAIISAYTATKEILTEQEAAPIQQPIQEIAPHPQQSEEPFVARVIPKPEKSAKKPETQHRYLQTLIKKTAEARGYKATIEQLTPDGAGRVDVNLEREGKKIAVEVSVTTNENWEAHNVEKCFTAGYTEVVVCSTDANHLQKIQTLIQNKLAKELQAKVFCLLPDDVAKFFDARVIVEQPKEKVVKGYRVKVEYDK